MSVSGNLALTICGVPPEGWSIVPEYEGFYEISNHGRVASLRDCNGRARRMVLSTLPHSCGYPQTTLCRDGKHKQKLVHRLVAEAFLPKPPGCGYVCHKDDDKTNNCVENLYWGTQKDNSADAKRNGRVQKEGRGGNAKLYHKDIPEIRKLDADGIPHHVIAAQFGVSTSAIQSIATGHHWGYVDAENIRISHAHRGSQHANAKLTEANVCEIWRLRKENPRIWTQQALANNFDVSCSTIRSIMDGRAWGHVTTEIKDVK